MKPKKIYIAGKITGDENYVSKFNRAASMVQYHMQMCGPNHCHFCAFHNRNYIYGCMVRHAIHDGMEVVNPASFNMGDRSWWLCMVYCLYRLMGCQYIYMLADWKESKGARIEHKFAKMFNKLIIYER